MQIEQARRGGYYVCDHGDLARLHSAYDPLAEAAKLLPEKLPRHEKFVLLGAGLGYLLKLIGERCESPQVAVFEPRPELLEIGKEKSIWSPKDFAELKIFSPDVDDLLGQLGDFLPLEECGDFLLVEWPDYRRRFPRFFRRCMSTFKRLQTFHKISLNTLVEQGIYWLRNFRRNLISLLKPTVPLFDRHRGNIALVAAGPSLDNQVDWLRRNRKHLYLITVNTAGPVLEKRGISSDLHVAVDYQKIVYEDLQHSNPNRLLLSPFVPPEIIENIRIPTSLLALRSPLSGWLTSANFLLNANAGGTVTATLVDLLTRTPARRVFLLGADMQVKKNRYYARGTWREERLLHKTSRFRTFTQAVFEWEDSKKLNGGSNPRLKDEREWLNRLGIHGDTLAMPEPTPDWWEGDVADKQLQSAHNTQMKYFQPPASTIRPWLQKQYCQFEDQMDGKKSDPQWEKFFYWVNRICPKPELELANWRSTFESLLNDLSR